MNLTEKPEVTQWPETHYVFVEKIGPFQNTAMACWQEFHQKAAPLLKDKISVHALYKVKPEMVYRAGVALKSKPAQIPQGMSYEKFVGGKYSKFTLKGSYTQLPEASGKVFELIEKLPISLRDGFFIENYVNDPATTAEKDLITEILVPTK